MSYEEMVASIDSKLCQLDSLLEAIRIGASPAVAADALCGDRIEDLVDVTRSVLYAAGSEFGSYHQRVEKDLAGPTSD
jgi:hypothetical protein